MKKFDKMSKEMTEWYPPIIKPVRKGVYQVKYLDSTLVSFANWTGKAWGVAYYSLTSAKNNPKNISNFQSKTWRGFKEKQE